MRRRAFLKAGAAAAAGAAAGAGGFAWFDPFRGKTPRPALSAEALKPMRSYTAEEHRRRLENIRRCEQGIRACLREHSILDYLPGQTVYNIGEYPSRKRWAPNEYDEEELDRLRDGGVQILQLHHEWQDWQRLFGGDMFTPINRRGFRRFIDMAHRRGMKVIVYCSTGWFERRDPDFQREWAPQTDLVAVYFQVAHCSPASPGWRAYMLPRLLGILDEYEIDGLYNDMGYQQPAAGFAQTPGLDEVNAFDETPQHDAALEDLIALVYSEVKRRGGIVKLHLGAAMAPKTRTKAYDYLWVGESVRNIDTLRAASCNLEPYVVPCLDMMAGKIADENELYLNAVPYMQFPLLLAGRPFTGERCTVPGVTYQPEQQDEVMRHCMDAWRHYQEHPEGPHPYGWWDPVPGRPDARKAHAHWLRQYLPMTAEGTRAYLEIADSDFFAQPLPPNVTASAFANRELYLTLANYNTGAATVATTDRYAPVLDPASAPPRTEWQLGPRALLILKRA